MNLSELFNIAHVLGLDVDVTWKREGTR
jgi:hypothetical protein